jgi:hypothetical protein
MGRPENKWQNYEWMLLSPLRCLIEGFRRVYFVIDVTDGLSQNEDFTAMIDYIKRWRIPSLHLLIIGELSVPLTRTSKLMSPDNKQDIAMEEPPVYRAPIQNPSTPPRRKQTLTKQKNDRFFKHDKSPNASMQAMQQKTKRYVGKSVLPSFTYHSVSRNNGVKRSRSYQMEDFGPHESYFDESDRENGYERRSGYDDGLPAYEF